MDIIYWGPIDCVDVEVHHPRPWQHGSVWRGQTLDVPDDIAAVLLEQPLNWQIPVPSAKTTVAKQAADDHAGKSGEKES